MLEIIGHETEKFIWNARNYWTWTWKTKIKWTENLHQVAHFAPLHHIDKKYKKKIHHVSKEYKKENAPRLWDNFESMNNIWEHVCDMNSELCLYWHCFWCYNVLWIFVNVCVIWWKYEHGFCECMNE